MLRYWDAHLAAASATGINLLIGWQTHLLHLGWSVLSGIATFLVVSLLRSLFPKLKG